MSKPELHYSPRGSVGFCVEASTFRGTRLTLESNVGDEKPRVSGVARFQRNVSLVESVWAYGTQEFQARRTRSQEKKSGHRKAAHRHRQMAEEVLALMEDGSNGARTGWCSCCFNYTTHHAVDNKMLLPPAYLCGKCGAPTARCFAGHCKNMAVRRPGAARFPQYCAEHRHEIPSFKKLKARIRNLDSVHDWLAFEKHNLASTTRIAVASTAAAAVVVPAAIFAAPAVGGAVGASFLGGGLSGAAATSHGLALLGFGSLASGGFGMAGGTVVVAATGGLLGGSLGAVTTSAYVSDDKSFKIERLKKGSGTPVIVASGFLTEGEDEWGSWKRLITERYPQAPVYRLFWGSKELKHLMATGASAGAKVLIKQVLKTAAGQASKKAAKGVPFVGYPFLISDAIANPWSVAKKRADTTGAALAGILARVETDSFILVGHSLGARVMATTASLLGTLPGPSRLESVHLLGAAVSSTGDWHTLNESVTGHVWNYHSRNDQVLSKVYRIAQVGQRAAGVYGLQSRLANITNVDCSKSVDGHSAYFSKAHLR